MPVPAYLTLETALTIASTVELLIEVVDGSLTVADYLFPDNPTEQELVKHRLKAAKDRLRTQLSQESMRENAQEVLTRALVDMLDEFSRTSSPPAEPLTLNDLRRYHFALMEALKRGLHP